jgi:hypothetical protein
VKPIILVLALVVALTALFAALGYMPALADQPFDWDRYHARQDACREKDRIAAQCGVERNPVFNSFVRRGVPEGYCDELALRQATRACSPFSGSRDRGR